MVSFFFFMNLTLSKRKYESAEEMSRDFWKIHYERGTTHIRPNERLWLRMHRDGMDSPASKLWHNQWHLLNTGSGLCWLPSHGPTNRRLFLANVEAHPRR